ncbi:MAG: IS256 family transposase, partial [Arenicellales bacterium]
MNKNTVVSFQDREQIVDPLNDLLRTGARKLIEQAIEAELQELL